MSELAVQARTEIQIIQDTVMSTAIEVFTDQHPQFAESPLPVLFAEARIATNVPRKERNQREKQLVHFTGTLKAVGNAVASGFVETAEDAQVLTDALLYARINPSAAIRFINPDKVIGKLARALTPRELAAAVVLRDDFSYEDETVSVPTLANAARAVGISLEEAQVNDESRDLLVSAIQHYGAVTRYGVVEDDPTDGPVMTRRKVQFAGSTAMRTGTSCVNPLQPDEVNADPMTRIIDYAEENRISLEDMFSLDD